MRKVRFARYLLVVFLVGLVAAVGFVLSRPKHVSAKKTFDIDDVRGRYVSAETAYDVSSVHAFATPNGSLVGPPVFFAATAVMIADGNGNVCGESDGFYGGTPPPGVNLGPNLFHGTYTVEAATGRITILTASDGAPSVANTFCGTTTPITTTGSAVYKTQVGYLQDDDAHTITTSEQINNSDSSQGGCCAVTGFLVHPRVWTKKARSEED
jgi:hypothetical protein